MTMELFRQMAESWHLVAVVGPVLTVESFHKVIRG
jgi:hypothetical protein